MKLKTMTATILAATLSTAALAQGLGNKVGDAASGAAEGQANVTAGAPINHGQVVSALRTGIADASKWADTLATVDAETQVTIVTLTELNGSGAENSSAIDAALASEAELGDARASIGANTHLQTELSGAGFSADDVVGFYAAGENQVVVIVDDRA